MTSVDGARGSRLPRSERREQLLLAARDAFVANGYHAAVMDDIATRAGVSKPVLYQHFPSKLELYLALLDTSMGDLLATIQAALAATTDNQERVRGTVRAYFAYVTDDAGAFRLVFESDLTVEPAVRERVDRFNLACATALSQVIAEDTGLPPESAVLLAAGLTGAAQVAARWWLSKNGDLPRALAEELMAALLWRGISSFPRTTDQLA